VELEEVNADTIPESPYRASGLDIEALQASDPVIVEAYNMTARRQRPVPKGGYKFPKADHIVSSMGPPPSPCKMCGSPKHWDRECPHKAQWEAMCTANLITSEHDRPVADDAVYSKAFKVLLTQSISSLYPSSENSENIVPQIRVFSDRPSTTSRRIIIEELYDDEGIRPCYVMTSQTHILEEIHEDARAELDPSININIPPPEPAPTDFTS
jgi:hypothetical protein